MSNISCLSEYNSIKPEIKSKEQTAPWPRYMKRLRSIDYIVILSPVPPALTKPENLWKLPKEIKIMTDNVKYLPNLKRIRIECPRFRGSSYLDKLWRFKDYPASIERFKIQYPSYSQDVLPETFLASLKKLKELDIKMMTRCSAKLMNSVIDLFYQVPQLESLAFSFGSKLKFRNSVSEAIKSLTRLKKVKLMFSFDANNNNIKLLESFGDFRLTNLDLSVNHIASIEDFTVITEFLKKQVDLETLKLEIMTEGLFKESDQMNGLVKTINSLCRLTSLNLCAESDPFTRQREKAQILSGNNLIFSKLFSKDVPLKEFRLLLGQPSVSKEEFMSLLEALKNCAPFLEKLEIDIGSYEPKDKLEFSMILVFIRSLKNVRSLKLDTLNIFNTEFFSQLIEEIYGLKCLRTLRIGDISGDITRQELVNGVEKLLSKKGLRKCFYYSTLHWSDTDGQLFNDFTRINIIDLQRKNPYLPLTRTGPDFQQPIFSHIGIKEF